ncbi:hypothetical protein PVAR5_4972 [Paecilomyces variotii No. 5]|uniref:F-box domain-containing protein n=1 Tax=Byssochlamys spectabilis (strain No. 5 / NBRC 109023) TaxID=1356009 RepID=V5I134_BYSSN|nr:hypothetical protein PVAR5_4972 [Paecilomyces variotii No. 5]
MNKLIHYPDILLRILEHVDLDTLLSLYETCVAIHKLIITYQATLTITVAQNTFPEEILRILERINDDGKQQYKDGYICNGDRDGAGSTRGYSICWLRDLIPRFLAVVVVDRYRHMNDGACGSNYWRQGIAAADPLGDPLRARVTNGFRILARLNCIAREMNIQERKSVMSTESQLILPKRTRTQRLRSIIRARGKWDAVQEITARREKAIEQKQLTYIDTSVTPKQAADYQLMSLYLECAFYPLTLESWPQGEFSRKKRTGPGGSCASGWLTWFMLREGISLLWQQWWMKRTDPDAPSLKARIQRIFLLRDKEQVECERQSGMSVSQSLYRLSTDDSECWRQWLFQLCDVAYPVQRPERRFSLAAETEEEEVLELESLTVNKIMDHVAFHVDKKPYMATGQRYYIDYTRLCSAVQRSLLR